MQGKNGEILYSSIQFEKWTISKFRREVMPGHKCREKCAVCKKHWGATKTVHVHMGTDTDQKTNFFCDGCLLLAQKEQWEFNVNSGNNFGLSVDEFCMIRPGGTYYCDHIPMGESWVILAVNLISGKCRAAGYPPTVANISDCKNWKWRGYADSEERKYIAAHFSNAY